MRNNLPVASCRRRRTPVIDRNAARRGERYIRPVCHLGQPFGGDGVADDEEPHRLQEPFDEKTLPVTEPAVYFGDDQTHAHAADFARS